MAVLREYEWQFLTQLVSRLYCAPDYAALCQTMFEHLQTLITFDWGICFQTVRKDGQVYLSDPVSSDQKRDISAFLTGEYPRWAEFIMAPSSSIFRQSDLTASAQWEKSRVYRNIWEPLDIYWGLFLSVVKQDTPLALLGFFRRKSEMDFSRRDIFVLNTLREAVENCLEHTLSHGPHGKTRPVQQKLLLWASQYQLTSREVEVAALIFDGRDTQSICQSLCISPSTLNKHLSSIFAKTQIKNRMQLCYMMSNL